MQILQRLFKGAHEEEREINFSPEANKRKDTKDQNAQGNKNIILAKHPRAQRRSRTSNIEERSSKHGYNNKNVKNIFAFICTKDIAKSCFYSTIKLNRVGSYNSSSREHFMYSMKMKRDEIARGIVGNNTNKADSAAHNVGKKVLPVSEERNELQCGISGNRDQIKSEKKKPISRMKELLRWAATAKSETGGKVNRRKVLRFRREGTLKTVQDDEEASIDSPKISFRWEVESCSTTTSSVYSGISVASSSKNGQTQVLPSLISIPHEDPHHIDCRRRKGNWITTDSEFVVLEL